MRRPEVQIRREPDTRARRATEVSARVHVPYGRACQQANMRAAGSRGLCGPSHPAQLGQAVQVAREGGLQLFSAPHLPAYERGQL